MSTDTPTPNQPDTHLASDSRQHDPQNPQPAAADQVVIVGGHGKVALLTAPKLLQAGYGVASIIRNPAHNEAVAQTGAAPVVLDIEQASVAELVEVFTGAHAVVFSAGAGGGNPARTHAVDYEAALRTMAAAQLAGVSRYVMVSYVRSETDVHHLDRAAAFYPYAQAKHDADAHLRASELDYTILGPGALTTAPASGRIQVVDDMGLDLATGQPPASSDTSRENVAEVITYVLRAGVGRRQRLNFYDGDTPIPEVFSR